MYSPTVEGEIAHDRDIARWLSACSKCNRNTSLIVRIDFCLPFFTMTPKNVFLAWYEISAEINEK